MKAQGEQIQKYIESTRRPGLQNPMTPAPSDSVTLGSIAQPRLPQNRYITMGRTTREPSSDENPFPDVESYKPSEPLVSILT